MQAPSTGLDGGKTGCGDVVVRGIECSVDGLKRGLVAKNTHTHAHSHAQLSFTLS
jgi:hypothetical protein